LSAKIAKISDRRFRERSSKTGFADVIVHHEKETSESSSNDVEKLKKKLLLDKKSRVMLM
jgi:hypothetical protein